MSTEQAFGIWITGIPASGKSSITKALVQKLAELGIRPVVLESDVVRTILTPDPAYSHEERDRFYRVLAEIGALITRNGVPVIFDATAQKRTYRDHARSLIPTFLEVYIGCPVEVCKKRDPKGIYARAASGEASSVPGIQTAYEPPEKPEITLDCQAPPEAGAEATIEYLKSLRSI